MVPPGDHVSWRSGDCWAQTHRSAQCCMSAVGHGAAAPVQELGCARQHARVQCPRDVRSCKHWLQLRAQSHAASGCDRATDCPGLARVVSNLTLGHTLHFCPPKPGRQTAQTMGVEVTVLRAGSELLSSRWRGDVRTLPAVAQPVAAAVRGGHLLRALGSNSTARPGDTSGHSSASSHPVQAPAVR